MGRVAPVDRAREALLLGGGATISALGEKTLLLLLSDSESMDVMVKHGVNPAILPTIPFREVLAWAISYYQTSAVAPTPDVLRERFSPDFFTDLSIDLDDEIEETIEWAIDDLEGTWIQQQVGLFVRSLAMDIGSVPPETRKEVLGVKANELSSLVLSLQPRTTHSDIRESGPDLLAEYEMAASHDGGVRGQCLGIPELDQHFGGIWPGEMFVLGGPAGTGKSFFADYSAFKEWERGRCTTIYTLENSILMNQMRIACCALGISIEDLQTGSLSESDLEQLKGWCNDVLLKSDTPLNIISPDIINRSPQALVAQARAYETESLIIDQLTHVEAVDPRENLPRNQEVAKIIRTLGNIINSGREKLPCLLLHQINREGIKAAAASGRLSMTHMAESGEIERTASVAATLYQSEEHRKLDRMQVQTLKVRRVKPANWDLAWQPWQGLVRVVNEVSFEGIIDDA